MIDWEKPRYVELPDLRMAVFEAGEVRADRPSVVLCHGWPELAYSWRHIVEPLVAAGFHVLVPDQRGYGLTGNALSDDGTAANVPLYDMEHLCGDLAHLLDAYNIERAVFVGHDWGGIVIWQLENYQAARVAGLVGVNTPHIPRLTSDPITAMREAIGEEFYIVAFQDYGRAEKIMEDNLQKTLRMLYRKAGGETPPEPPDHIAKMWERFELVNLLQVLDEKDFNGVALFDEKDFAYYENAFARTGFRGGINWYRNFSRNWQKAETFSDKISVPALMICAEDDRVLPPSMAEGMPAYVADLETHIIANCGHWTQNEQPQKLATIMTDWLSRRFA